MKKRPLRFDPRIDYNQIKVNLSYIRGNVLDRDLWSDLHASNANAALMSSLRWHFSDLGANITELILSKFTITPELMAQLKRTYK